MITYQQILAQLVAKFQGVRKDGLEQLARALLLQCTSEEEAKALVEKITEEQVNSYTKEYRKVVDKEVSEAGKTIEENLKKKYKIEENEPPKEPKKTENEPQPSDLAKVVADAVASAVKPLQERLEKYEQGEVGKTRLQALNDKLASCKDETFKAQTLKDFARMNFDSDDAFNEYLSEKEADIKTANQSVADSKLGGGAGAPQFGNKNENGVSKAVADFVATQKGEATTLTGKEV